MRVIAIGLVASLLLLPRTARAGCRSIPECLQRSGLPTLPPEAAIALAALAAPVILAGGFVTAVRATAHEKPLPPGVVRVPKQPPRLSLVPTIPAQPPPPAPERPSKSHEGAVRFNDTAANVVTAVAGAAVLAGILAGLAKKR